MDMDSYLSSIDAYMQQQEQREKEEQLQQQQTEQSQPQFQQQFNFGDVSNHNLTDIWLNNLPTSPDIPLYYNNNTNNSHNNSNDFLTDIPVFPGNQQMSHDALNNFSMPSSNDPIYLTNPASAQPLPPPTFGQPIRVRKKPGRKPNPASPALRKAQNRAAQRAFRERKERHLKDLENSIRNLREQRNSVTKELNSVKRSLESFKVENWYLKGVVLTLQLICYQRNVSIATHAPYLSEAFLTEMAKTSPHAVDAYVNAYKKNNLNLKTSMSHKKLNTEDEQEEEEEHDQMETDDFMKESTASTISNPTVSVMKEEEADQPDWLSKIDESEADKINSVSSIPRLFEEEIANPVSSSLDAIHYIRLKLGLKATLANNDSITDISAARLKPNILQLAIPHDPRIDLIPTPHMRDRMIIFREQMDYDRCFQLLLNEAVYHGGDPTLSESWELPADFFSEFWYLCIYYDVRKTNKWRRIKGLADVFEGPQENQYVPEEGLKNSDVDSMWNEKALDEIVKGMPVLKPIMEEDSSSPKQFEANDPEKPEYYYERMMGMSPEARKPVTSFSYENIVELMKSL